MLDELAEFDTALIANTIGYLNPTPAHEYYMGGSIRSLIPQLGPTVGVAVTCEMDSSTPGGDAAFEGFWAQLDDIKTLGLPSVWVVKTVGSRPDHECVLGDGMAKLLHAGGCVGVVTDGGVRDVRGMETIPFAAYGKGTTIHHCAIRIRSTGKPVEVGGITIQPGDVIHANAEGVIRVPSACVEALPLALARMRAAEHEAHLFFRRTDLSSGEKQALADEVFEKYGFASTGSEEFRTAPERGSEVD
jgi:regulator of RNase E activity RraA